MTSRHFCHSSKSLNNLLLLLSNYLNYTTSEKKRDVTARNTWRPRMNYAPSWSNLSMTIVSASPSLPLPPFQCPNEMHLKKLRHLFLHQIEYPLNSLLVQFRPVLRLLILAITAHLPAQVEGNASKLRKLDEHALYAAAV